MKHNATAPSLRTSVTSEANQKHPLESLLAQHCPNGVEFKTLGELLQYEQPTKYIVQNTQYNDEFSTPVLTAGASFILGYTDETNGIYQASKEKPCIIFDDFTTSFHWVDFPFKVKSSAMKILTPVIASEQGERGNPKSKSKKLDCHDSASAESRNDDYIQFRFIYYAMKCIYYFTTEHARQWISKYSQIPIPLPPLPVQEKIVEILDKFTQLQAELQAELQARRKQYEYYRNKLLSFEELQRRTDMLNGGGLKLVTLGELGKRNAGTKITANQMQALHKENAPVRIFAGGSTIADVDYRDFPKKDVIDKPSIICKARGYIGFEYYDKPFSHKSEFWSYTIEKNANQKFIYYFLVNQQEYFQQIAKANSVKIPQLKVKNTDNFQIPLPPLAVQNDIVELLDKFDTLANDLTSGIPAEIDARKKQYEYYRERLLSFIAKDELPHLLNSSL